MNHCSREEFLYLYFTEIYISLAFKSEALQELILTKFCCNTELLGSSVMLLSNSAFLAEPKPDFPTNVF